MSGIADEEGDAAVGLLAEGVGGVGAEEVGGSVAEGGEGSGAGSRTSRAPRRWLVDGR